MRALIALLLTLSISSFASVDINTASAKELTTLKGIGKAKAEAILRYRQEHCFESIEDLTKVKGIGKKIVEKNANNITLSECKR